jgi:hypothetical protein
MRKEWIDECLAEIVDAKINLSLKQEKMQRLLVDEIAKTHPHLFDFNIKCPFFWECVKSPFGYCTYDDLKDPAWDNCIYCGESYERK